MRACVCVWGGGGGGGVRARAGGRAGVCQCCLVYSVSLWVLCITGVEMGHYFLINLYLKFIVYRFINVLLMQHTTLFTVSIALI